MIRVPRDFKPLLHDLSAAFPRPLTARRLILFFAAAVLLNGARTVSGVLRLLSLIEPLNPSTFHRLFSHRRWSSRRLAKIIATFIVDRFASDGVIRVVGDETVDGHRGRKVYGKARHRDAVRSSHSHTAYRYGHKWIVLAVLMHRFPERKFVFAGDGAYGTHPMSRFAYRHRRRLTLVSKFVADANLFLPPAKCRGKKVGRPRVKGKSLPAPCQVVAKTNKRKRLRVRWYGGGWRNVEVVTGIGHWFKSGKGLVPVRWVFVRDLDGTHRDEYFFSTDPSMSAKEIIEHYGGRWNIETTFQEMREHLGLETTRGWHRQTVLRMAPCLFLLYSVVTAFYDTMPDSSGHLRERSWSGKATITFSDMIASVRHHLWLEWVFEHTPGGEGVRKLSLPVPKLLDFGLTQAA